MREIAMIGMGCRFPESPDLGGYWRTVRDARVGFRDVPPDRWDRATFHSDDRREPDKTYGRKMGLVEDIRSFAPEFYGISPRRARVMDPQQRLLLDVTRDALEDAGYGRRALPAESTGVFVGATVSEHTGIITSRLQVPRALSRAFGRVPALSHVARAAMVEDLVPMQADSMVGQLLVMLAANLAQAFDFRGPTFAVDAACAPALVALHEAVLHLRAGLIDAAVVGGVYLNLDCVNPVCFSRIGVLSPSDRCRPFDAVGDGFVLGEGAGAVVLKRLDRAIRDGDRVWGVIRGIALNNDGRSDGPIAPRPEGQAAVLRRAYRDAGVTPGAVAHVGSSAPERLRGDRRIMADLGFDSLMVVDLLTHLEKTFPALAGRCGDLIERDLTVDDLTTSVAAKLGQASGRRPSADGPSVAQLRGLRARPCDESPAPPRSSLAIEPSRYRFEDFPEVRTLRDRLDDIRAQGLTVPYFRVHEGVTRDSTVIAGRHYINFSSYNYLGLSGDPEVTRAAAMAAVRYGTSVSASRVASGERPVHRDLEAALARFLGCEDAIVMVSGHATNVSVLGHLLGPEDLIVHDALAHDSILGGARLSGARRRPFAHNDMDALEEVLATMRPGARRVLIAVEGVYSLDGDLAPLDRLIELKRRYRALLLVDEAHSLGVVGRTGRGIGEHFGVDRGDVDLWMGTLSKSLASCGGYIAGSAAVVDYLKYSAPGFVYSVGLSPANAAAALAALEKLEARPGLVDRLRERSRLFLELCRDRDIDTGSSDGSAIVPCIVGDSPACLRLAEALAVRGIDVQPILAPAVPEHQARLRFFITARHTEAQLVATADALAREWARLDFDTADFAAEACA